MSDGSLAASLGGNGREGHTLEWSSDGVRNPQVSLLALRAGLGNSAKVKELVELGDDCLRVVAVGLVACTLGGALPFEGPVEAHITVSMLGDLVFVALGDIGDLRVSTSLEALE